MLAEDVLAVVPFARARVLSSPPEGEDGAGTPLETAADLPSSPDDGGEGPR